MDLGHGVIFFSFQVVSHQDGCSKVHSQRIWHSLKISQTPGIGGGDVNAKTVTFLKRSPSGAGSEEEEEERPAGDVNANRYTFSLNLPVLGTADLSQPRNRVGHCA